jgi:hypothetical protein
VAVSSLPFEILDRVFAAFRPGERIEYAKISALVCSRIALTRVKSIFTGLQLLDHGWPMDDIQFADNR